MGITRLRLPLAAGAGLALGVATLGGAPAGAQLAAKPAPDCTGIAAEDAAGDQAVTFSGVPLPVIAAGPNTDITKIFVTYDAVNGVAYANVQVTDLTTDVPAPASDVTWYVTYTLDGAPRFVAGRTTGSGFEYEMGNQETTLSTEGSTTGSAFEGKDGVLSIAIPNAGEGSELTGIAGFSATSIAVPGVISALPHADDVTGGGDATVQNCAPPVELGLGAKSFKAKGKRLSVKLVSSGGAVSSLTGMLKKGKTTYGKGTLAKLDGKGTLKLKLSRKARKGSYVLDLSGTSDSGAPVSESLKLKLK